MTLSQILDAARYYTQVPEVNSLDQGASGEAGMRDENGQPVQPGLVYAARIRLACGADEPERSPLCDTMQPGMSLQAEIKTGKRRIIQYLLSPISKTVSEAGRER